MTSIFLSYARADDEPFVRRLHDDLVQAGFTVWFDRESLLSRGLTFHQEIKDAIRTEVDRIIYVGGPKAAASPFVREEWKLGLEFDHVVVIPILRLGNYNDIPGELSLLHCEDFREGVPYEKALARLIDSLRKPNPKFGALVAVPSLPPHFLARPELMRRVRDALLVDLQTPQVITSAETHVGMQGMVGIGKSVLAAALARNRQIRQAYPDGIVWITCGQQLTRDDILSRLRDLVRHLGGDVNFTSLPQGQGILRELLQSKAVLLILDDVWRASDAKEFDFLGPRCRMLITTRDAGILHTLDGERVPVSLFSETEALQLLAEAVDIETAALPPEAREVVDECGLLPLALALSGGMAKKRGGNFRSVLERLRRADLDKIADRESINPNHETLWRAMQASVEMLPDEEQRRFAELAVFPEDAAVPEAAVATLWAHTGRLDDLDTEDLLISLSERALIQLDTRTGAEGTTGRRISLHDLLHDYAKRTAGDAKPLHQSLIEAYWNKCSAGWPSGPNDGYFFEQLVHHLVLVEDWSQAEQVVTGFAWLMRKCELGLLDSIGADYGLLGRTTPDDIRAKLIVWQNFFREKGHILRRGLVDGSVHKIFLQLAVEHADDSPLTRAAEAWLADDHCDWFRLQRVPRPVHATIDACLSVLEGHTLGVNGALLLPEGRILSCSNDGTLRLWDGATGVCLSDLAGHTHKVSGALMLPYGRFLSWSWDRTLRIWDSANGACLRILEGHKKWVEGALELPEARLLSWSSDETLRVWDAASGACLWVLEGHTNGVSGVLALPEGRVLSWSEFDKTLRVWDPAAGTSVRVLEGHTDKVKGALVLPDGRILSWSLDKTLRIWDSATGVSIRVLEGHWRGVFGALLLPSGDVLSWSVDYTLRAWDSATGACLRILERHEGFIEGALVLPDGYFLSWSWDRTLRIWDSANGACLRVLEGHTDKVCGALLLSEGKILSWSDDGTLRIWDTASGDGLSVMEGHSDWAWGMLALSDGRLLSWSKDGTLRVWNAASGACRSVLKGHTGWVGGALALPEGKILSWSRDKTFRVWDSVTGTCLRILSKHSKAVWGALMLPQGKILSWSEDKTLCIWDSTTGDGLSVLGHTDEVLGALVLADGRFLSWSKDKTLRVWDSATGACLDMVYENQAADRHPDWLHARAAVVQHPKDEIDNFFGEAAARTTHLRHRTLSSQLASWNAESTCSVCRLFSDGIMAVGQDNGQVCILNLYQGRRRTSLAEAEQILSSQREHREN